MLKDYISSNEKTDFFLQHHTKGRTVLVIFVGTAGTSSMSSVVTEYERIRPIIAKALGEDPENDDESPDYAVSDMVIIDMEKEKAEKIIKDTHGDNSIYPYMQLWIDGKYREENT